MSGSDTLLSGCWLDIRVSNREADAYRFLRSHTMLELRPNCERCDVDLPPSSLAARICSFECTFCADCAEHLTHLCPNCGGELVRRPVRPAEKLQKYPAKMRS